MNGRNSQSRITDELCDEVGTEANQVQTQYDEFWTWMMTKGKNPRRGEPLSEATAKNYIDRLDRIHRQTLQFIDPDEETIIQADHADDFLFLVDQGDIRKQNGDEYSESAKRKLSNTVKKYLDWRHLEGSLAYRWRPQIQFKDDRNTQSYRFSYAELGTLLATAESYSSLPPYDKVSAEKRDQINARIAQQLGTPKTKISQNDWKRADQAAKIHSLISVGYDGGLTPIEIGNAAVDWYNPEKQELQIPSEKACKQREKETVALSDDSATALNHWLDKRRTLEQYRRTDKLWLNQDGNPYSSGNLCYLIRRLCEEADIPTEGKEVRWYSLRYTMGTNVTEEGDLSEANDQLRHSSYRSTKNYDKTPVEKLKHRINTTHEKATRAAQDPEYNPFADTDDTDQITTEPEADGQSTGSSNDVVTRTSEGTLHADVAFPDTTEARVDITRKLLTYDDEG